MCLSQDILCTQKYVKLKGYLQSVIYMIILSLCTECIDCTFADVRKNKTRNPEISCLSNVCLTLCTLNKIYCKLIFFLFFFFFCCDFCRFMYNISIIQKHRFISIFLFSGWLFDQINLYLPSETRRVTIWLNSFKNVHYLCQDIRISSGFLWVNNLETKE